MNKLVLCVQMCLCLVMHDRQRYLVDIGVVLHWDKLYWTLEEWTHILHITSGKLHLSYSGDTLPLLVLNLNPTSHGIRTTTVKHYKLLSDKTWAEKCVVSVVFFEFALLFEEKLQSRPETCWKQSVTPSVMLSSGHDEWAGCAKHSVYVFSHNNLICKAGEDNLGFSSKDDRKYEKCGANFG